MFLPYSTDEHDGKVGIVSVSIVIICLIIQAISHFNYRDVRTEISGLEREIINQRNSYTFREQLSHHTDHQQQDEFSTGHLQTVDSLRSDLINVYKTILAYRLAFIPQEKSIIKMFTSMFAHAGWIHLLSNILFFYVCGVVMEKHWGHIRFLFVYLACGIGAVMAHLLQGVLFSSGSNWDSRFLLGASGAIAGTMGAMLAVHPNTRIKIFYWIHFLFNGTFKLRTKFYLGIWISLQILKTILDSSMSSGVAFSAHIGGFATGILFGLFLKGDEVKFGNKTSENTKTDSFLAMSGYEPLLPQTEPTVYNENKGSLLTDGWMAFAQGQTKEASEAITRHIETLFFHDLTQSRTELCETMEKLSGNWKQLGINGAQAYQWGKKLQERELSAAALICYEIAVQAESSLHVKTNSRYLAAVIRYNLKKGMEKTVEDLLWIIENAPESIPAKDARNLLQKIKTPD
ncbi:rhomboid family serine protease [Chitinispirillum alkaliphilum]|nr:rhomboid family serine protease [Chitinispirillum alkaliphilum]